VAVAIDDPPGDPAARDHRQLGDAMAGLELDAARAQVAGHERVGDPAPARYAFDPEHAVVAAARVARRLIVARRPQLDRRDQPGALGAIDHAADDDRRGLEPELDGREGPGAEPRDPDRARGERALVGVELVAALRQVREPERAGAALLSIFRGAGTGSIRITPCRVMNPGSADWLPASNRLASRADHA